MPGPLAGALAALALGAACQPLDPAVLPPEQGMPTPCTLESAVRADVVVVRLGVCNPWCVRVPAGTSVALVNQDQALYRFADGPPVTFEIQLPPGAWLQTPALPPGTTVVTELHLQAATVTIYAE